MAVEKKFVISSKTLYRDVRPFHIRVRDWFADSDSAVMIFGALIVMMLSSTVVKGFPQFQGAWDAFLIFGFFYFRWLKKQEVKLPLKLPAYGRDNKPALKDPNNKGPGGSGGGKLEGILYLGNERKTNEEVWVTSNDAKTHILYLGTTGSGKTEGLKTLATNALTWGSGFTYVDGKADTGLWGGLYALARRFGRDDDLLVINYMTANSDDGSLSNTMNPFSNGSASYLVQMLTNLMSESGGDNAMWKERAVSLIGALMPALTYMRDKMNIPLDISTVRDHIELKAIIALTRRKDLPERILKPIIEFLKSLPGYVDDAYDDEGNEKPPSADTPAYDSSVARQQHGYLTMQFTRSLQSLSDEYAYIFKSQMADVDVIDLVLNRRILVVLIPALEKSKDEAANLGKIVAASLKGMMGAALGAQVEGSWEMAIENKATNAPSPYMVIFDEVGYYTSEGMAVMAAQARSLGFSLVFASQDLPSMEKRVKEEARSITGNCNIKIFGKLEDPIGTKEFFEKSVGSVNVMAASGMQTKAESFTGQYSDNMSTSKTKVDFASYDDLKLQREGQAIVLLSDMHSTANLMYSDPGRSKALRVQRLLGVHGVTEQSKGRDQVIGTLGRHLNDAAWTAANASAATPLDGELADAVAAFARAKAKNRPLEEAGLAAVGAVHQQPAGSKPATKTAPAATAPQKAMPVTSKPVVQASSERRAPASVMAPSESDVLKTTLGKTAVPALAPFVLPKFNAPLDGTLKNLGGKISHSLFGANQRDVAE